MSEAMSLWSDPSIPDESLTELLIEQYYSYIVRLSASILHDFAEAEDVAQDTFVIALTKIESINPDMNLKAWLSTIAVNKCRDILRKRKVRLKFQTVLESIWIRAQPENLPENSAVHQETAVYLWTAVDQLKEKHRLPILLRYMHNLTIREIAEILDTHEGTIHSRLHYACQKLQIQLEINENPSQLIEGVTQ